MLLEWHRPLNRIDDNEIKRKGKICGSFLKRNGIELSVLFILIVVLSVFIASISAADLTKYSVECEVSYFNATNVTDAFLAVQKKTALVENTTSLSSQSNDTESQSYSLSRSPSASGSVSNSVNDTYLDDINKLFDPYWIFNFYCIFAGSRGKQHITTDKVLVGEFILYNRCSYFNETFAVGTMHQCVYNENLKTLTYLSEQDVPPKDQKIETILIAFCVFLIMFDIYYVIDKERHYHPSNISTSAFDTNPYIQQFNEFGGFSDHTSGSTDGFEMELQFIPTSSNNNNNN